jgi:PAS domain S-box-containing protein
MQSRHHLISAFKLLPLAASWTVIIVACLLFVGWVFDFSLLKNFLQWQLNKNHSAITPNALICFILSGVGLLLLSSSALNRRRLAHSCAMITLVIAVLTTLEYLFGWDLGTNWLLIQSGSVKETGLFDSRMAPNTALNFVLIAVALLLFEVETRDGGRPAQSLAVTALLLSLLSLLGYAYRTPHLYEVGPWPGMAITSALSFIALSAGIVASRPDRGLMAVLTSESSGGYMARRLLIAAILVPSALGWVNKVGQWAGYYDPTFGVVMLVVANVLVLLIVMWRNALSLHFLDIERMRAEAALRNANTDLEKRVNEQTAELVRANKDLWSEIEERARIAEELRRSREELEDFFENAPVGALKVGPDGIILWANRAELDILGYRREDYVGHHISEFHADQEVSRNILDRLRGGGTADNFEASLRAKDGSIRHVIISSNVLWKDGQFVYTRCFTRDVTESKQAQERLRESEERFRLMADSAPVMIWLSDADKLCYWFNLGWLDFTGRTLEQEQENGWADGIYQEDFERCLNTYITAFDAREEFKMEYRLRRYDGEYRWVLDHGVPRFHSDGKFAGYIGSSIEIHERKQAEEALRMSEEFNRSVLECSADCIMVLSLDGRLISMNSPGMEMMEIEDFSLVAGAQWTDLWDGEARAAAEEAIGSAVRDGVGRFTGCCRTKTGKLKWWEVIISPMLDVLGRPERLVAISRDITERKQIERERDYLLAREQEARAEAEEANRLKDEFLATVSHELRAPLNAIQGWVKLLREGRLAADEAERALETIERSARAQNRIISDLLDVSRIITGNLRLNIRPIQPGLVIESAIEGLRPAAEVKRIALDVTLDGNAGPISGDSDRLRQIVWNLISNAIKFTPNEGRVQVRLERAGPNIEITVSDTGIGIEAEFLPYVFDRFRQADSSSTRRQGGLGLGLAIVRHLTEMQGGNVRAESFGPGLGATFIVRLPLIAAYKQEIAVEQVIAVVNNGLVRSGGLPQLKGLRVLVVDDDEDARILIKTILTQCQAVVKTARSVNEAVDILKCRARTDGPNGEDEWQPDLLISDIEMPEADGYAMIHKLRDIEAERGGNIPAIALTAYTRIEDRMRALAAGFQMHVGKPIEPDELLTVAASLTGRLKKQRGHNPPAVVPRNIDGRGCS